MTGASDCNEMTVSGGVVADFREPSYGGDPNNCNKPVECQNCGTTLYPAPGAREVHCTGCGYWPLLNTKGEVCGLFDDSLPRRMRGEEDGSATGPCGPSEEDMHRIKTARRKEERARRLRDMKPRIKAPRNFKIRTPGRGVR